MANSQVNGFIYRFRPAPVAAPFLLARQTPPDLSRQRGTQKMRILQAQFFLDETVELEGEVDEDREES